VNDEVTKGAILAAEQLAEGQISADQLATRRHAAQEAFLEAKRAEYVAEAEAQFSDSADYAKVSTTLYATAAIRAALTSTVNRGIELLDAYTSDEEQWEQGHRGCHYWAAAAIGESNKARFYAHELSQGREDSHDAWTASDLVERRFADGVLQTVRSIAEINESARQSATLRHIVGNPFRPYPATPSWPSTVVKLAESLYAGEDCSFALHDALLEAGHPELAEHFAKEQWHPKGCWVVDTLLGKS